jgi:PAS domain S-box-containing protein
MVGTHIDMTERKMIEEEIKRTADMCNSIIVQINKIGKVELINEKGAEILGYKKPSQIIGKNWFDKFLPIKTRKKVKAFSDKMLSGKVKINKYFENTVLTKSGKEILIGWHGEIVKDKKGNIIGHLSAGKIVGKKK